MGLVTAYLVTEHPFLKLLGCSLCFGMHVLLFYKCVYKQTTDIKRQGRPHNILISARETLEFFVWLLYQDIAFKIGFSKLLVPHFHFRTLISETGLTNYSKDSNSGLTCFNLFDKSCKSEYIIKYYGGNYFMFYPLDGRNPPPPPRSIAILPP